MESFRTALPRLYLVTPEPKDGVAAFMYALEKSLAGGIRLVQFRAKTLDPAAYRKLAIEVRACCRRYDAVLLLNAEPKWVDDLGADGVHLDGARLLACRQRPLPVDQIVGAACHTLAQLRQAETVAADMVTLSPVLPTASHPGASLLGWEGFEELAAQTVLPVYALGGMHARLLQEARKNGAYGVAGIAAFWGVRASLIKTE